MTVEQLATKLAVDSDIVRKAVYANGFSELTVIDGKEEYLISLYVDYLNAMEDAKISKDAFKYTDGEESVDKSKIYEQHRRYALDMYDLWKGEKDAYDASVSGGDSRFRIRRRAGFYERTRY